jgi:hypothetical protein
MQKYIYQIIFFIILAVILFSCSVSKVITGEIRAVKSDSVLCAGKWFKVAGMMPKIGDTVTFAPTRDSSKVNSIKLQ